MQAVRIGIDTGRTFTDALGVDGEGRVYMTKTPSTAHDPSETFVTGLSELSAAGGFRAEDIELIRHGPTVALNGSRAEVGVNRPVSHGRLSRND